MKRSVIAVFAALILAAGPVWGHDHGGEMTPDQAEQHAACMVDITEKSAAAGMPVKDAATACHCLGKGVTDNPSLMAEIQTAGGLPPREQASAELRELVEACMAADQAS